MRTPLLALGIVACSVGPDDGRTPADDTTDTDTTTDDTDGVVQAGESLLLHRLEASAWRRSVRDLLHLDAIPDVAMPPEATISTFDHMIDGLVLTPYHIELFDRAAYEVTEPLRADDHPSWTILAPCALDEATCRADVLGDLATRAWRRPLEDGEVERYAAFVEAGIADGLSPREAVVDGIRAVLSSPYFLFRIERRGDPSEDVDAWELASRLAAFLWKSVPDEALRAAAASGDLLDPEVRAAQARRMLADPRSDALIDDFAGQWLEMRSIVASRPEDAFFPAWDLAVRQARKDSILADMRWRFDEVLTADAPIADLLRGNQGLVDANLATLYEMTPPPSGGPTVTTLPSQRNGGLLTSAGWLIVTSKVARTSPTRRGKWIIERLFCSPPSAPPPGVDALPPGLVDLDLGTIREVIESVTADPFCQACHSQTDPYGFAFEQFGHQGRWGTQQDGGVVNPKATLPTGEYVVNANVAAGIIASDARIPGCFVQYASTYALGRTWPSVDLAPVLDEVEAEGAPVATTFERIAAAPYFARRVPAEAP